MPLIRLPAAEAVANRKNNPFGDWGSRESANRVEPVAKPGFETPFKLAPGEAIFTVGSCFARNVESELLRRGFKIPMRDLFKRPEFEGVELSAINNFGTPSIHNELAWALGEKPFVPEEHIVEVMPGKFADLHVVSTLRPGPFEMIAQRRAAIIEGFRAVRDCRVVIMTLGLVEVWFDSKTGYFLNSAPRPGLIRNEPDRFELHVLSFEEAHRHLADALKLIAKHGRPDVQVLLTVSPVPLRETHRTSDVMVANCYSKSVLRAVAETVVAENDLVHYFPSYESVTLSDRRFAWQDDMIHVTDQIVALNVGRMIDGFVGADETPEATREAIAAGGAAVAADRAGKARLGSRPAAAEFFAEFGDFSKSSREFAIEHAQFLLAAEDFAGALSVLQGAPPEGRADQGPLLLGDALMGLGRPQEALAALEPPPGKAGKSGSLWKRHLEAALATEDPETIIKAMARVSHNWQKGAARSMVKVGRWFFQRGDVQKGLNYLEGAVASADEATAVPARVALLEALIVAGRRDEAWAMVDKAPPAIAAGIAAEIKRVERLRQFFAA